MSGSNVPTPVFGPTGFIAPLESAILAGVTADFSAAFGGNLNPAPNTPQGQIAASETAIIGDCNANFLLYTNLVDPAYSYGRMQDAIARIYFLTRNPAQPTVLQIACVGLTGVVIPAGALIQDQTSNIYACITAGVIAASGTVTLPFANQNTGPLAVPAANAVSIYQAIPGWDSVSVVSGVLGNVVEGSAAFELRRQSTVEGNSLGSIGSIIGAVAKVPGVLDYYGYDNAANAGVTFGGQFIAANSIYICVAGGSQAAVAQAILSKKGPGCSYSGNTTIVAYDSNPLYANPVAYNVTYEVPSSLPIAFTVTIKNSALVPSNALALIQAAISNAFSGSDGGLRARIGSEIFASRFYAGVASLGSWAQIVSILIGSPNTSAASFTGSISGSTLTVASAVVGTIGIGQIVIGVGVLGGTQVVSGSGTTWTVTNGQTVANEALSTVLPALNDLTVQINQVPTLDVNDIILVLQ